MSAQTSGFFRHFRALKKHSQHLGSALLAALLAAPALAQTCDPDFSDKTLPDDMKTMSVTRVDACRNTINYGGLQEVQEGSAINTTITYGGGQRLGKDGRAEDTTLDHGEQIVNGGGWAERTTLINGGWQEVHKDGVASITNIYDGVQEVKKGGRAKDTTIHTTIIGGYQQVQNGGWATRTTINSGTWQVVDDGGTATSTTINSGGMQYVQGTAIDTVMKGGGLEVGRWGQLSDSLEVHGTGNTAQIQGGLVFPPLKFFLPAGMNAGDTMLAVDNAPDLSGASVTVTDESSGSLPGMLTLIDKISSPPASSSVPSGFTLDASGGALVLRALYSITLNTATGGNVNCSTTTNIAHGTGTSDCKASETFGYTFGGMTVASGTADINCNGLTCTVSKLESNVTLQPSFTKVPSQPQQPQQPYVISSTPTMGELGLLLSGIALAGAAVPALRRREKQGKKADTRQ